MAFPNGEHRRERSGLPDTTIVKQRANFAQATASTAMGSEAPPPARRGYSDAPRRYESRWRREEDAVLLAAAPARARTGTWPVHVPLSPGRPACSRLAAGCFWMGRRRCMITRHT
uniref:Uncharacterized protein n=1 Tax=Oryza nivara TaxID=4536 RepID=A0A0E0G7Y7_ORYNI